LLLFGVQGKPLLAAVNSYHSVSAVVDCIMEMSPEVAAAALSSGTGTCLVLTLIETFPDQAVRLLQHVGMTKSHETSYNQEWNRRMMLPMDGMVVQSVADAEVGSSRYPRALWSSARVGVGLWDKLFGERQGGFSDEEAIMVDVVAVHSSFPHACGMLPHKYVWGATDGTEQEMDYCSLQRSFLHLSYNCGEARLFDTPLGRAVLQYKWEAFGKRFALIQLLLFILHLAAVFTQVRAQPPPSSFVFSILPPISVHLLLNACPFLSSLFFIFLLSFLSASSCSLIHVIPFFLSVVLISPYFLRSA
jgi:hypothetical protein